MKTNPSYTHLKYSLYDNLWHVFVIIAIALGIKVGAESEPNQVVHWLAVLQSGVFLAHLFREFHTQVRRKYFVTLGDRVMLARSLHRDPDLRLWAVMGFSASGEWVLLQSFHPKDGTEKQIRVSTLFRDYTRMNPGTEEREPLTGE